MKLMSRLMRVLPMQTTTNLAQLASAGKPEVETDSTYRRLQRFFAEFDFGYQQLGRFLLDLVPTEPPYVAVLDRTEWHFGQTAVNVLMIGIAEGGIAYPITWSVLEHGGGSGADEHTELLKQFLRLVKPDELRALVADREPAGSDFLKALDQREIPFVIRLKKDRRIGPPSGESSGEWSLPSKMFARACQPGQSKQFPALRGLGGTKSVGCQVTAGRLEEDSFLILAGQKVGPESMLDLYRKRWEIETLFAALGVQRIRTGRHPHDRTGSDSEAPWRVSGDLQLDTAYRTRPEVQRGITSGVCKRVSGEKPLPLMGWTVSESLWPTGTGCETSYTGAFRRLLLLAHFCRVVSNTTQT
ncbi:transposase [Salinibacter ruber]|uniref:transposase n=1 Tax=Salinibacter ruber TaxID=146919 RepID=UPI0021676240|nr:transposase [Salinibacter ruber]